MKRLFLIPAIVIAVVICNAGYADRKPEEILKAIVKVQTVVPADAVTAPILGTERSGSVVLIDSDGHVLTIGYLILEARITYRVDVRGLPPERFVEAAHAYRAVLAGQRYRVLSEAKRPERGRVSFIFRSGGKDTRDHIEGLFEESVDPSLRGYLDWEVD